MGRLYFMIGLARSGKSTLSRRWNARRINFNEAGKVIEDSSPYDIVTPRVVVSADKWRLALGHRYNSWAEPMVHGPVRIAVRALLMDHDVLVDETNTTASSIKQWLEEDINAVPVLVNTPLAVCKRRAIDSGQADLIPVLERMHLNLYNTFGKNLDIETKMVELRKEVESTLPLRRMIV